MKAGSIAIAVLYLGIGIALSVTGAKIEPIYSALFPDVSLPLLTRLVLIMAPVGWLLFGLVGAGVILAKESISGLKKIPDWPFAVLLVAVILSCTAALFYPLVVIINAMGS